MVTKTFHVDDEFGDPLAHLPTEYFHEFFHRCAANHLNPKVAVIKEILKNPFRGISLYYLVAALNRRTNG